MERMSMKKAMEAVVVTAAAVSALASCGSENRTVETNVTEQVPLVSVVKAVAEKVTDKQVYSSSVKPWVKNSIAPQTVGRIDELLVEVGDYVEAGQVVAKMDDMQLLQSELQVANDKVEMERLSSLYKEGGLSQSDFEAFELACKVHEASYRNLLENTVLRSPVSGVVSARNYDSGDMFSMGQPLYVVEQVVPVKLMIAVSESDYSRIRKGIKATIVADALPRLEFYGTVTNVYPTIDAATHTFAAEVKVPNPYKTLRPGMYARVTVIYGQTDRVLVPDVAVVKQQGSGDRFVYKYDEASGTVTYQKVLLGQRLGDRYVILEGLNAGDEVVTDGILRIKDGVKVKVK